MATARPQRRFNRQNRQNFVHVNWWEQVFNPGEQLEIIENDGKFRVGQIVQVIRCGRDFVVTQNGSVWKWAVRRPHAKIHESNWENQDSNEECYN